MGKSKKMATLGDAAAEPELTGINFDKTVS